MSVRLKQLFTALALLSLGLFWSGCANMQTSKAPGADLHQYHSFYVAKLPADGRGIEKIIASRLQLMGYQATSGDTDAPPSPVDALVTYQDKWMWDITMYMIKLDVQIRDGKTNMIVANGESMRPSLQRKSPEGMVEEVLGNIFKQ